MEKSPLTITAESWKQRQRQHPTLAVFAFQEDIPVLLGLATGEAAKTLRSLAKSDGFKGREREMFLSRPVGGDPAERTLLIGLGKKTDFTTDILRRAVSKVIKGAETLGLEAIAVRAPQIARTPAAAIAELQAFCEGLWLASYHFDRHQTPPADAPKPLRQITVLLDNVSAATKQSIERARVFSEATMWVRDLVNEPPSLMNPDRLTAEAEKLQKKPISVRVFEKKELESLQMGGILGVGAGSAVPPRLIELHYKPSGKARKTIALVGKGITFDSGGLSLKPPQNMETMKMDMAGSATVLGVFSALPRLNLPVEVWGYLAIAENMPGGRATKPGDILKTYNGKTIEVLNTDAEGRLVLADALAYASKKKPDAMIDIATLTGACVVALGSSVSGVLGNSSKLIREILAASDEAGEKIWEMPLVKEYKEDIKSKVADVKNIGTRRGEAGTIIGGLFLQEFVDVPSWAHLDIAGPAWVDSDQPYCPAGATGHPVRTLLHYLESL